MDQPPRNTLAATRLRPPGLPDRVVARDRLAAVLVHADTHCLPLVLVSAPAGSGKSTLVANWAATRDHAVAWLQLEDTDADPARFWVSVVAAIGRANPALAARIEPTVAGALGAGAIVVPTLVNEIAALDERFVLVLDDFHLIDDAAVHRDVEHLIEVAPANLTVVLITRADPPFRLGRLRVRGRLAELRADDLRFATAEAKELLGAGAEGLDSEAIGELCDRTEGWAAGLVLAGLSLARTRDSARFVRAFRGDDHLVAGYLTDELLAVLDTDERRRMVEASVLHRLSGPLLDTVTGSTDGARWLDELAARNQLVIRLDAVGEWYRYHHLFRDLLLAEARRSIPLRLPQLHHAAADWFEGAGHPAAAVDHLLAAGDRERAMYLMRIVGPDLLGSGRLRTLRSSLARLSAGGELDAICSILSGWDHYLTGRYDLAEHFLAQAKLTLPPDVDSLRTMPLQINLALGQGDVATALAGAREVVAGGDLADRASELTTATGAAFAWAGLPDDARSILALALARTKAEQRVTAHAMALVAATIVEFHAADDETARAAARRALDYADSSGLGDYHGIAPAIAISAVKPPLGQVSVDDLERSVTLARRAATTLGHLFVLTLAGDALMAVDETRGAQLLAEAQSLAARCPDPGIAGSLLRRATDRHRLSTTPPDRVAALVEQLTQRETAVLRHLPSTLSLTDIARELYVSPNTVKTQCKAIYRKLQVTSRSEAVQAAREHGLL